jgi:surface polysaccharide O-acyltransferase-like enzyme
LLAAEIWARRALGDPNPVKFTPAMLLYGPQIHLWFLPFVALAGPFAAGVQRCTTTWSARAIVCAVVVLGSAAVAAAPRLVGLWPLEQWAFSLPAVCLGFGLGTLLKRAPETSPVRRVALPFALCVCLVCLALPDSYIYGKRYVSAVLLIAVCSVLPNRPDPVSKLLSPLMLGIYVLHMFVYHRVIEPALDRLAFDPHGVARVFVTFCVTATIVALCRCTPLRRVL